MVVEKTNSLTFEDSIISIVEDIFRENLIKHNIKNRLVLPSYTSLDFFETYYNNIKLEYLVDFRNSNEEYFAFFPEYNTFLKENLFLLPEENKDYFFIQQGFSFSNPDRSNVREYKLLGICSTNDIDYYDSLNQTSELLTTIIREVLKRFSKIKINNQLSIFHELTGDINFKLGNNSVAVIKSYKNINFLSGHICVEDLINNIKQ